MKREELLAKARRELWASWAISSEEMGSQAADTLYGLGMLVGPGEAAELVRLRRRVAELETERHVTNEALDDAARALRANRDRIADLEAELYTEQAQHRTTLEQRNAHAQELLALRGGHATPYTVTPEAHAQMREGLTRYFAGQDPTPEGEHYASVHHAYRVPRDLPPLDGVR